MKLNIPNIHDYMSDLDEWYDVRLRIWTDLEGRKESSPQMYLAAIR